MKAYPGPNARDPGTRLQLSTQIKLNPSLKSAKIYIWASVADKSYGLKYVNGVRMENGKFIHSILLIQEPKIREIKNL